MCQAAVRKKEDIIAADKQTFICGKIICAICSSSFGNEEGIFRCKSHSGSSTNSLWSTSSSEDHNQVSPIIPVGASSDAAAKHSWKKKSGTTTMRTSRDPTTQCLIKQGVKVAEWKSPTNFIVEDNILKQILGFDALLFNVDML
jgi:hypothetical protein